MRAFSSLSTAMLKGFYRDKLSLFFAILFPLFFIVIFGTVFANSGAARPQVIEIGAVPLIDTLPAEAKASLDQAVELVQGTSLLRRDWQRIGARIVGSWIAASAILVLALRVAA